MYTMKYDHIYSPSPFTLFTINTPSFQLPVIFFFDSPPSAIDDVLKCTDVGPSTEAWTTPSGLILKEE